MDRKQESIKHIDMIVQFLLTDRGTTAFDDIPVGVKKMTGIGLPADQCAIYMDELKSQGFIREVEMNGLVRYSISFKGIHEGKYSTYLVKKKANDELDEKIKKLTLKNSKFQNIVTVVSVVIAVLAFGTPFVIRYLDRGEIKKVNTEIPELKSFLQTQQQMMESIHQIQKKLTKDTLPK